MMQYLTIGYSPSGKSFKCNRATECVELSGWRPQGQTPLIPVSASIRLLDLFEQLLDLRVELRQV
jgi:hypothetical protein